MRSPCKAAARPLAVAALLLANLAVLDAQAPPWDPFFATPVSVADLGANNRTYGVAAGDFDGDGVADLVVGRVDGRVHFLHGNGDGTFAAPVQFAWKVAYYNAWAFTAADIDGDGRLDVVLGANALSTGCSISPIPAGQTCASAGGTTITVNDGDVRAFYGTGNGFFVEAPYFVNGVRHNAGALLADVGTLAGSLAVGDVDGDGDEDVVVGAIDGANTTVKLLRNSGSWPLAFSSETVVSQPTSCASPCSPIYFPAISTQNSPWGLALGDVDGDGDLDLWVGDRALYVYLFMNNGAGVFSLSAGHSVPPIATRPNAYLAHDAFRAAVGYTASLASGDINGDGKADLVLGLHVWRADACVRGCS